MELELRDNNLFINGTVYDFGDDEQILLRENMEIIGNEMDKYHIVKENDRLDVLAWTYYKNIVEDASKFWWLIADANKIYNPLDLSSYVGKEILIPDLIRIRLYL